MTVNLHQPVSPGLTTPVAIVIDECYTSMTHNTNLRCVTSWAVVKNEDIKFLVFQNITHCSIHLSMAVPLPILLIMVSTFRILGSLSVPLDLDPRIFHSP